MLDPVGGPLCALESKLPQIVVLFLSEKRCGFPPVIDLDSSIPWFANDGGPRRLISD